ncbi:MAG: FAD-binding oxidoreductase [Vibrio ordalii]|uniref:FAD-binding oxidoreductase n=1 Tax=Vibrio ordalii TaxID=28174 RepID=UPI003F375046
MLKVSSWGNLSREKHNVRVISRNEDYTKSFDFGSKGICFGVGRSYGDVCLNPGGTLWNMSSVDRVLEFDSANGILRCEAGMLLRDIQQFMVTQGWMLSATPGTQFVTVGGAIANDVHGKNHHVLGSFGDSVLSITLLRSDGEVIVCGPGVNEEWFSATVGGIGLTGIILEATIQLRSVSGPWLDTDMVPFANLKEFFELSESSEKSWQQSVSWIDCVSGGGGRGLFMRGNDSEAVTGPSSSSVKQTIPFTPPISLVNSLSLKAFNMAYYNFGKFNAGRSIQHYQPFFYPLDNINHWNRMYGPKGFYQYQSVVPLDDGELVIQAMLNEISRAGSGSFLAVLKTFGDRRAKGLMSFPQPGVTLALDFPNKGKETERLFERLDAIVAEAKGRLYLAKDARMPQKLFELGYPNLEEFLKYRDPTMSSAMSRRLMGF